MSDKELLMKCVDYANQSKNNTTQVGALLSDHGGIVAYGFNHLIVNGIEMIHAEESCICHAAMLGVPVKGLHMYATWACCDECAKVIIESGVGKVITLRKLYDLTISYPKWFDKVVLGLSMLHDYKIPVVMYEGELGKSLLFNGEIVNV